MEVQYHPALEGEIRDIISYYDECCPGLGQQFLHEFDRQVLRIVTVIKHHRKHPGYGMRRM